MKHCPLQLVVIVYSSSISSLFFALVFFDFGCLGNNGVCVCVCVCHFSFSLLLIISHYVLSSFPLINVFVGLGHLHGIMHEAGLERSGRGDSACVWDCNSVRVP